MQARKLGYDYPHQHYHKTCGNWLDVGWGLYRLRDYPTTDDEELVRLTLWSRDQQGRPQAVVSHETALRLYDLSDLLPSKVHLSVPKRFRKPPPPGVILHKRNLTPEAVRSQGILRLTTPHQTLLDLAESSLSPEHLAQAAQQALERGLVRRKHLQQSLTLLPVEARQRLEQALETTA